MKFIFRVNQFRLFLVVFLIALLVLSMGSNLFLVERVLAWKGKAAQAKMFPERMFDDRAAVNPAGDNELWLVGDSRITQWPEKYLPAEWKVVNFGKSGWTTREIADALSKELMQRTPPKLLILQCGINDIHAAGFNPEILPILQPSMKANYRRMLSNLQERGCIVYIIPILPRGALNWEARLSWHSGLDQEVRIFNEFLPSLEKAGVRLLDVLPELVDQQGFIVNELSKDSLHLKDEAYEKLTSSIESHLANDF